MGAMASQTTKKSTIVQQHFQAKLKTISTIVITELLCEKPLATHKGPIKRKAPPCHNLYMLTHSGRDKMADIFLMTFSMHFLERKCMISQQFFANIWINNIPALIQIMIWHRRGDKPLSDPMVAWVSDTNMRHSASMSWYIETWWCIYVEVTLVIQFLTLQWRHNVRNGVSKH